MAGIHYPCPRYRRNPLFIPVAALIFAATVILAAALGATTASANNQHKDGKVHIHVRPKQAYIFVDGRAIRDGSQTIALSSGRHVIGVHNYGYVPETKSVDIVSGKTIDLNVSLAKAGEKVAGPFGDIELKGHPRAAVLLDGSTPAFFVGHVDEFDNNWIWHQWLLVQPGSYQVTVTRKGHTIWSGSVAVKAGQRVVVYLNHDGKMKTKSFKRGLKLGPQPRFDAGVATAVVPIAPVTAELDASQSQAACGPGTLAWNTANAPDTSITNIGTVPANGDRSVRPQGTTTYELVARGPGGEVQRSATIHIEDPTATLALSEPEVTYHKVGDKVVEDGSTTLTWSTSNGNKVTIEPLGTVATSGSRTIEAAPTASSFGPINQEVRYTLNVSDSCGGTASRTATLHVVGSIDPPPAITLASVFYPSNYPRAGRARTGLVSSEEQVLATAARRFENREKYDPQASLVVVGHADVRGSRKYNLILSRRRADFVKHYLVTLGIPADEIRTRADGKNAELTEKQVAVLQSTDDQSPEAWMKRRPKSTWMAYNRRVDIVLEPGGQHSTDAYPNDARYARILWQRAEPSLHAVESAARVSRGAHSAALNN